MNEIKQNLSFAWDMLKNSADDLNEISYQKFSPKQVEDLQLRWNQLDAIMLKLSVLVNNLQTNTEIK